MNEGAKTVRREANKLIAKGKELLRLADYLEAVNGKVKRRYRRRVKVKAK